MKLAQPTIYGKNDFPGENENFYKLLDNLQRFMVEVNEWASKKISPEDNFDTQLIDYTFTDGVPVKFSNKLGRTPVEAQLWMPVGSGQPVTSFSIDYNKDNELVLTINFKNAGASGRVRLRVR